MSSDFCEIPKCKNLAEYYYYGKGVCEKHWNQHCKKRINLKKKLNVREITYYQDRKTAEEHRHKGQRIYYTTGKGYYIITPKKKVKK